jgi:4-amino-4-deoxy-L-arabinose transferase-like glycosyltransferase
VNIEGLLLIWIATLLVFFSMSGSKLAPYIVPAVPPLALLAGRWLETHATVRKLWPAVVLAALLSLVLLCLNPLVPQFVEAGLKQTAYLQIGSWARAAGLIGLIGAAAALVSMQRLKLRPAVIALSSSVTAALAVLMCGSNSLEVLRVRPGLAAVIAPYLTADTSFYCVGMYWQSLPFALRRTCTLVQYTGEMEFQFDPERRHWLPAVADFIPQWNGQSAAVAIVSPSVWPYLQTAGLAARTVIHEENVVVIVKP